MDKLTEIKEALSKATPGPWYSDGWALWDDDEGEFVELNELSSDAQLIAHAPEDMRYLIDELEAAKKQLEADKKAEAEGSLVRLPCKVGDTIYYGRLCTLCPQTHIDETEIYKITIGKGFILFETEMIEFYASDIGKTVFLTREEAEAALKERENKNGD